MSTERKVILYLAISLDGYIAGPEDDLSFLDPMQTEGEDYNYAAVTAEVDTLIMGRKTYDKLLSFQIPWPHPEKDVYVLSRTRSGSEENIAYFNDDLAHLIADLRSKPGKNIYLDAGGEVVASALQRDLIDQMIISVVPILLGDGKRLFWDDRPSQVLTLERSLTYPSGLVQLWYSRVRPS